MENNIELYTIDGQKISVKNIGEVPEIMKKYNFSYVETVTVIPFKQIIRSMPGKIAYKALYAKKKRTRNKNYERFLRLWTQNF